MVTTIDDMSNTLFINDIHTMQPPRDIPDLLRRIADQAKRLPKEQALAVAHCIEYAIRGTQEDAWYQIADSITEYHNQPHTPLLQIENMTGNVNAIEQGASHADTNQPSQRGYTHLP